MEILDLDKDDNQHEAHYLFLKGGTLYVVHDAAYELFMASPSDTHRSANSVLVIDTANDEIKKSRYF